MKFRYYFLITVMGLAGQLKADKLSEPEKQLLKKHLELCKKHVVISDQAAQYLRLIELQKSTLTSALRTLQDGSRDAVRKEIDKLERGREYAKSNLKLIDQNIASATKRLQATKHDEAMEKIIDDLESKKYKLRDKLFIIRTPYKKRSNEILKSVDATSGNQELKNIMTNLLAPSEKFKSELVDRKIIQTSFLSGTVDCAWYRDDEFFAIARITLCSEPPPGNPIDKLSDRYPIYSMNGSNITFKVSNFLIALKVKRRFLEKQYDLKKIATGLIDLKQLATAGTNDIIESSLATSNELHKIHSEEEKMTAVLQAQLTKAFSAISNFKRQGYCSSEEHARNKFLLAGARANYQYNSNSIKTADYLIKLLRQPPQKHRLVIAELQKKIDQLDADMADYCYKYKQSRNRLAADLNFSAVNRRYRNMAAKFFHLPQGKRYAQINRMDTDSWLGNPNITCCWFLDMTHSRYSNMTPVFKSRITYDPDAGDLAYSYAVNRSTDNQIIDQKYRVFGEFDHKINIKAGQFLVEFEAENFKYHNRKDLIQAAASLIDLDALADAVE